MSYVVLARKWRPQKLDDLLGQEHIARMLSNAIESNRVAHAFLFSGPRGVGKTSAARILAKALCCEQGPTKTPCGTCPSCTQITEGRLTDVFEIDAASHTGVDNVREIVENVRYLPSLVRYKIYVIDEVHMLSTGAFNALLKTLEEPPEHVKFILATTDVHKVPATILSRCQRYDFRRISNEKIAERLEEILTAEGVATEKGAMQVIATEAEGSMRDAQSLLEQVLSFAEGKLTVQMVRKALGVVDGQAVRSSIGAILGRDVKTVLEIVGDVYRRGLDLGRYLDSLVGEVRDLMVARMVDDAEQVIERPQDEVAALRDLAKKVDPIELERLFSELCRVKEELSQSTFPRFVAEVNLAMLAEAPPRISFDALLEELKRLRSSPRSSAPTSPLTGGAQQVDAGVLLSTQGDGASKSNLPAFDPGSDSTAPSGTFLDFVALVKKKRPAIGALLAQVRAPRFDADHVEWICETAFDEQKLTDGETARYLRDLLTEFLGKQPRVSVTREVAGGKKALPKTHRELENEKKRLALQKKKQKALNTVAVKALREGFGAEVEDVRVLDDRRPDKDSPR